MIFFNRTSSFNSVAIARVVSSIFSSSRRFRWSCSKDRAISPISSSLKRYSFLIFIEKSLPSRRRMISVIFTSGLVIFRIAIVRPNIITTIINNANILELIISDVSAFSIRSKDINIFILPTSLRRLFVGEKFIFSTKVKVLRSNLALLSKFCPLICANTSFASSYTVACNISGSFKIPFRLLSALSWS